MPKPLIGTYSKFFENYISLVPDEDLPVAFINQHEIVNHFFDTIDEEKSGYSYAPGKWTLKEVLQHIIDGERIFSFRALSIARNEKTPLPGFEENDYAAQSNANNRSWKSLCEELKVVRKSTELLFSSFTAEMLHNSGTVNDNPATANALGFMSIGHLYHHKSIIETRYLSEESV